ncbi:MAG: HAD family hydrolase [archaeon]|nr:HAD family hydrolase [archaeon]
MVNKIKGVLIDLDDTLYEYEPCNEYAVKVTLEFLSGYSKLGVEKCRKMFLESRREVKKNLPNNASSHSRLLYFKRLVEKIYGKTNPAMVLKLEKTFWNAYFKKMRLRKTGKKFLEECKKNGVKTIIVTNLTARVQLEKVVKLGLQNLLDFVITSEETGSEKPNARIIDFALKSGGLDRQSVIFLGDKDDQAAAKKAKIEFILINSDADWKKAVSMLKTRA